MPDMRSYLADGGDLSVFPDPEDEYPDEWRLRQLEEERLTPVPRVPGLNVNGGGFETGTGQPNDAISVAGWGPDDEQPLDEHSGHSLTDAIGSKVATNRFGAPVVSPYTEPPDDLYSRARVDPNYAGSQLNPHPNSTTPALDRLSDLEGQRPLLNKPKWWQRLAAGVAGGVAGWTNNDGRHHNQIDIGGLAGNILHPGYQDKLAQWQSRVIPAQTQAEIEAQKTAAALKEREERRKEALEGAQAEYYHAHGQFMLGEGRKTNPWAFNTKTGQYFNKATGETKDAPKTLQERFDDFMSIKGADGKPVYSVQEAKILSNGGKLAEPKTDTNKTEWESYMDAAHGDSKKALDMKRADEIARARESRDPNMTAATIANLESTVAARKDKEEEQRKNADKGVGDSKIAQENKIHQQRQSALQQASTITNPTEKQRQIDDINNKAVNALQAVDDEYQRNWRGRGYQSESNQVYLDQQGNIRYRERPPQGYGPWQGKGNFQGPQTPPATPAKPQAAPSVTPKQAAPAPPPPPAAAVIDPNVQKYANRFFSGDIRKAQAAIAAQRAQQSQR